MVSLTNILQGILLAQTALSASVTGHLKTTTNLSSTDVQHTLIDLLKVSPNGTPFKKSAYLQADGTFQINGLHEGTYIVSVSSLDYNLVPYKVRLDVTAGEENEEVVNAYSLAPGQRWEDSTLSELALPLVVYANPKSPKREYVKKRNPGLLQSGPLATVVNNPLYLGGAIIALTLALIPKILEFMDPEGVSQIKYNAKAARAETNGSAQVTKKLETVVERKSESPVPKDQSKKEAKKSLKKRKN